MTTSPSNPTPKTVNATGYRILPVAGTQMYSALLADSQNRMYMATCDLRRPAYLIRLDPTTGVIERLGNMQDVTGECDPEQIPQSKIHSHLVMDSQKRIWFGTHNEEMYNVAFGNMEVYPKGYPGGHLINFDPATGKFTDYGIPFPQTVKSPKSFRECGLYFLGITKDPQRDVLYTLMGDKIQIAAFDMTNGKLIDCQPAPIPYPYADHLEPRGTGFQQCRDLRVGADGNVYTFTHNGQLMRYRPVEKRIELLDLWVPGGSKKLLNQPYAMVTNPDHTKIYGNGSMSGNLFELTILPGQEPTIRDFGIPFHVAPEEKVIHGITMGLDGLLYFIGSSHTQATFYSLNPQTGALVYHGPVVFNNCNGAVPHKAWAACTAQDGTLWYAGDIHPGKDREFIPNLSYFSINPNMLA